MSKHEVSYQDAGVDIHKANQLVDYIKTKAALTPRHNVVSGIGGFAACYELPQGYRQPVLVSATDGVGTKLKLALQSKQHNTIGIDLVAMCVNDLIVCGATPLYFLDYYATGKLSYEMSVAIIDGIVTGCQQANMTLIGGETAEMPGMYHGSDYDLAGFAVGVVEKSQMITADKVQAGDQIIGLAASGFHSNGYSLIRKIITDNQLDLNSTLGDKTLAQALLTPTKIYVPAIMSLLQQIDIHAMAHITGGGFYENIPRVLPPQLQANITLNWPMPAVYKWLQQQATISQHELFSTFNCGIGMMICVAADQCNRACDLLQQHGETCFVIGEIETKPDQHAASVVLQ